MVGLAVGGTNWGVVAWTVYAVVLIRALSITFERDSFAFSLAFIEVVLAVDTAFRAI